MPRIKLTFPDKKLFTSVIPVRITDINYGNHVGNDAFVQYIQEARMQWLSSLGFTELNIGGKGLIMADLVVTYRKEVFYGDILSVELFAGDVEAISFSFYYRIINQQQVLVAEAKTGMVCYDYALKKVSALPPAFAAIL